jgi:hypothetical protein
MRRFWSRSINSHHVFYLSGLKALVLRARGFKPDKTLLLVYKTLLSTRNLSKIQTLRWVNCIRRWSDLRQDCLFEWCKVKPTSMCVNSGVNNKTISLSYMYDNMLVIKTWWILPVWMYKVDAACYFAFGMTMHVSICCHSVWT